MLGLLVSEYIFFVPVILNLSIYWYLFFKNNVANINKKNNWDNSISVKNIIINQNPTNFIKLNILFNIMFLLFLFTFQGYSTTFWWSHFKLTNFNLYMFSLVILFSLYFMFISDKHIKMNNIYSIDYIFALINIILFIPFIFLTNTLFTFFFTIELVSCSIFYKFIVGKFFFNNNKKLDNFFSIFSKNYLNLLFFQYWSSFFSSILIIFSIYFLMIISNSTEWLILNFVINSNSIINYVNNEYIFIFVSIIIILGFIIKLGIAPIQLYKIEIYRGVPFLTIFFYTVFYFLVFFLFFSSLIILYLSSLINYTWIILLIIIILGVFYIITLIFDINLFKAFLAYSTIINSVSFLLLILAIIF